VSEYRVLGRTGIHVSPLCFGTMMFGAWGSTTAEECAAMVHRAMDAGINFFDTADVYAYGESEEILGKALRGRRDDVVLATKVHNRMVAGDPNSGGNSRRWIIRAVEDSLRRLGTDRIDLYQIHRPDPSTDIDETLSALDALIRSGKVRAIGTSTFPAHELVDAWWVATTRGYSRFATEQPPYSIFTRGIEAEVLPTCERLGLGALVWAPLNGGWLTGKYTETAPAPDSRARRQSDHFDFGTPAADAKLAALAALRSVAADAGLTLIELAIGFCLAHPAVTSAIVGPRRMDHLESMLSGGDVVLGADVLDRIDEIVAPGTNLNAVNAGYVPPSLTDPASRRRHR